MAAEQRRAKARGDDKAMGVDSYLYLRSFELVRKVIRHTTTVLAPAPITAATAKTALFCDITLRACRTLDQINPFPVSQRVTKLSAMYYSSRFRPSSKELHGCGQSKRTDQPGQIYMEVASSMRRVFYENSEALISRPFDS